MFSKCKRWYLSGKELKWWYLININLKWRVYSMILTYFEKTIFHGQRQLFRQWTEIQLQCNIEYSFSSDQEFTSKYTTIILKDFCVSDSKIKIRYQFSLKKIFLFVRLRSDFIGCDFCSIKNTFQVWIIYHFNLFQRIK